jgi:hypothetical protein
MLVALRVGNAKTCFILARISDDNFFTEKEQKLTDAIQRIRGIRNICVVYAILVRIAGGKREIGKDPKYE